MGSRVVEESFHVPEPQWWFVSLLVAMTILAILCCEGFGGELQLPWWGVLLALLIAMVFTLPLYPGKPLANVAFKTYGTISMAQALTFLQDFKLGHYMKIPPKSMFIAQVKCWGCMMIPPKSCVQLVSTMVASTVCFSTAWWLLTTIPNICDETMLPDGSPWTCPGDTTVELVLPCWCTCSCSGVATLAQISFYQLLWMLELLSWVSCFILHYNLMISMVHNGGVLMQMTIVPWLVVLQLLVSLPGDVLSSDFHICILFPTFISIV